MRKWCKESGITGRQYEIKKQIEQNKQSIITMMKDGKSNREISNLTGIPRFASLLIQLRKEIGMDGMSEKRKQTKGQKDLAVAMMKDGKSNKEISDLTGVHCKAIWKWRKELKVNLSGE